MFDSEMIYRVVPKTPQFQNFLRETGDKQRIKIGLKPCVLILLFCSSLAPPTELDAAVAVRDANDMTRVQVLEAIPALHPV
jgi:hypothetical protein